MLTRSAPTSPTEDRGGHPRPLKPTREIEHDRTLYKQRNRIERMFGHLKINHAIATRYDQLASGFLGMVHLATARYWLKFVHAAYPFLDMGDGRA